MVKKESHPQQIMLKRYEKEILTPGFISLYIFIDIIYTSNPHVSFIFVFIAITIFISITISLTITMSITINIFISISITALIFVTVLVFCFCFRFCLCFRFCFCFVLFCFCFCFIFCFCIYFHFRLLLFHFSILLIFSVKTLRNFFFQKSPKSSEEKIKNIRDEKSKFFLICLSILLII